MSEERTEEPTAKKLRDARERGEHPRSRDLVAAAVLLASSAVMTGLGPAIATSLRAILRDTLSKAAITSSPFATLHGALEAALFAVLPALLAIGCASAAVAFVQIGPMFTSKPVSPDPSRLDPIKGFGRIFSRRSFLELAKSVGKLVVLAAIAFVTLRDAIPFFASAPLRDAGSIGAGLGHLVATLLLRCGIALGAIGVLDLLHARWEFMREQRMSRSERKREARESEGDPRAKQQRERMHREILAHATIEEVRRASVLVVNPTHFAVALRYDDADEDAVPEVLAKGQDDLARRMIRAAEEAGVPVMRDVPLAQALYVLELGEGIPPQLYEAVAIVLRAAWEERGPP